MKHIADKLNAGSKLRIFLFAVVLLLTIPLAVLEINKQQDTRSSAAPVTVQPSVETESYKTGSGDVADDSAIWFNSANPSQSVVVGDNKDSSSGGIGVYDLTGKEVQFRQDGYIGNVDLRNSFQFGSQNIILVGGNHRGNSTIVLYKLDPTTRQLSPIPGTRTTGSANYGFCFYKSKQSGKTYAFVLHESGLLQQHELVVSGTSINSTIVRSVTVGSQSEGCAADDDLGNLYVGEEAKGLWKYSAEPGGGSTRTAVDSVGGGNITADVEGVSIAYGANGTGYILVSSQGNSTFAVYRREAPNAFVKTFTIGSSGSIDAVSSTDGIDVMNANFGTAFPKGLFVAHDASNTGATTGVKSNLKFVPLERIVDMGTAPTGQATVPPQPTPTQSGPTSGPTNPQPTQITGGPTQPATGTRLSLTVFLHGIGKGGDNSNANSLGNQNPLTRQPQLTTELYNAQNALVKTVTAPIVYNPTAGNFTGQIPLGTMTNGVYQVRFQTPKYLWKRLQQIVQITNGQATTIPAFSMIAGDTDNNNAINVTDFNRVLDCFSDLTPARNCDTTKKSLTDFTDDGSVNQFDYNLFLRELAVQCGDTCNSVPTGGSQPTQPIGASPTRTQTAQPTLGSNPGLQSIQPGSGIWISTAEIMKLPMSGPAWDRVRAAANGNWGSACMDNLTCNHDVDTLAGALVAVRTNDAAMKTKVISGIQSAMNSPFARALETSRNLQSYVIAADIIGYRTPQFETWIRDTINANLQGHSGGDGVLGTAFNSSNNWGGHARAASIASALYLKDTALLQKLVTANKAMLGLPAPGNTMVFSDTTWHADPNNKAGINRKGAVINGKNVSGAIPEDWRRNSTTFSWPPPTTGYMWGALEGQVVVSVMLHRANLMPFNSGDNAVVRAMDALYGLGEAASNSPKFSYPAEGDDTWIPWVVNYYGGTNYTTTTAQSGKNMGWTDWTHQK